MITYEQFVTNVETNLTVLSTRIESAMSHNSQSLNDHPILQHDPLIWPIVVGKFEEACRQIWKEFHQFVDKVAQKVAGLIGDPSKLSALSAGYTKAAGLLNDEATVISNIKTDVDIHWSGVAASAFATAAQQQATAIAGIVQALDAASAACAASAKEIFDIWTAFANAILDYADNLASDVDEATDVGKLLLEDVGPTLEALDDTATALARIETKLTTFFADDATIKSNVWDTLNNVVSGLTANNDWPPLSFASDMSDKGEWTPR